jgi:predicted component of type VI protein secretion system
VNKMTSREQLHHQIDALPDDVVEQIADFALFVMARRQLNKSFTDWSNQQWQAFALEQLLRDGDDVEYTLDDAKVIYKP